MTDIFMSTFTQAKLTGRDSWVKWFQAFRLMSEGLEVWKYVNPDALDSDAILTPLTAFSSLSDFELILAFENDRQEWEALRQQLPAEAHDTTPSTSTNSSTTQNSAGTPFPRPATAPTSRNQIYPFTAPVKRIHTLENI
ncbi:hypothetical protein CSAL01_05240 [Colletotrichum salicis]|uniref:Uncharacterized protein n=1 Tax=Colletotrichum salicis TaxID=1209931 RepID=A0A135ULY5_9PEZI|nr:hypothetical protein CSAL01_05240 [Colletotrichum salicis]